MRIEKVGDLFVAYIKFEQRGEFKRAGWIWNVTLRKWVTGSVQKASDWKEFAVGDARNEIESFLAGEGAIVQASKASDSDIVVPSPPGKEFLPFQRAGIAYAVATNRSTPDTLIADPPGLGKTIQAIGVANLTKPRSILIVCPASLKKNWLKEFRAWDVYGMSAGIVTTVTQDKIGRDGQVVRKANAKGHMIKVKETVDVWPNTDVVIINPELFDRHNYLIKEGVWDLMIVDEAHAYINIKAKRSKHIWGGGRGRERVKPIMAKRRLFLTGTPMTKSPIDLWQFVRAMDPKGLGRNWETFVYRYCAAFEDDFGIDTSGASNHEELSLKLRDSFMVRRRKTEVLPELPPKRREIVLLPDDGLLNKVEREMSQARSLLADYEQMMGIEDPVAVINAFSKLMPDTFEGETYESVASKLTDNVKVSFEEFSAYRRALAIAKVPLVIEHVNRLVQADEKVVLFCYHKEVADQFKRAWNNYAFVTGATPSHKRQDEVDRFQEDEDCMVFIGNIAAAGTGFTLTASSIVVFAELSWLPSELWQAEDRIWRIGQDNACLIQHLIIDGSLDARMVDVLLQRVADMDRILE